MITKQRALFYFVGTIPYKDIKEAQKADLRNLLDTKPMPLTDGTTSEQYALIVDWMIEHAAEIVDTLTTTPTSRMKARKLHGGTKKHKQKVQAVPLEQK